MLLLVPDGLHAKDVPRVHVLRLISLLAVNSLLVPRRLMDQSQTALVRRTW